MAAKGQFSAISSVPTVALLHYATHKLLKHVICGHCTSNGSLTPVCSYRHTYKILQMTTTYIFDIFRSNSHPKTHYNVHGMKSQSSFVPKSFKHVRYI